MNSIFISHSHKDKVIARKIAKNLEQDGLKIWIDEAELNIGDSLLAKISNVILEIDYLIVIITENSISSDWVKNEINIALKDEKFNTIKVLPLKFENCTIPDFLSDKIIGDFTNKSKYIKSYHQLLGKFNVTNINNISLEKAEIKFNHLIRQNPFYKDLHKILSTIEYTDSSEIDFCIKASNNIIDLYKFLKLRIIINPETNIFLFSRLIALFVFEFKFGQELIFNFLEKFDMKYFNIRVCSNAILSFSYKQDLDYILWAHKVHIKMKSDDYFCFFISDNISAINKSEDAIFESIRFLLIPDRGPKNFNFDSFYHLLKTLKKESALPLVSRVFKWINNGSFDKVGYEGNYDLDVFYRILNDSDNNESIKQIIKESFRRIYGFIKDNNEEHKDIAIRHLYSIFENNFNTELNELYELFNRGRTGTEHMNIYQSRFFIKLQNYYEELELKPEEAYELKKQHEKIINNAYYKYRKSEL